MTVQHLKARFNRRSALAFLAAAPLAAATGGTARAARDPAALAPALFRRRYLENGWDRRFLQLRRMETGERFRGVYFEHGAPLRREASSLRWMLRDVRAGATHPIDPELIELLRRVQQKCDGRELIITSGYRTRRTNALLARRGAVKNSLHLTGRAVDFFVSGEQLDRVATLLAREQKGGVGLYQSRGFIHADLGRVRFWRG